jgi:hypothetical protein
MFWGEISDVNPEVVGRACAKVASLGDIGLAENSDES